MRVCVRRTVPTPSAVNRGAAHTAPLTSLELCPSALKAASPRGCSRFRVGAGSPPHFTGSPWSAGKSLTTASLEKNCPGLDTLHICSLCRLHARPTQAIGVVSLSVDLGGDGHTQISGASWGTQCVHPQPGAEAAVAHPRTPNP